MFFLTKKNLSDNLVVIRYEDLALNTTFVAKQLYKRLDLDYTEKVDNFINKLTQKMRQENDIPLIKQNITQNVFSWIVLFESRNIDLDFVQSNCSDVMQMLGYNPISLYEIKENQNISANRLISNDFPLKKILSKRITFIPDQIDTF